MGETASDSGGPLQGPLPLTLENVDLVLDEMRPYLLADGGNVAVRDVEGGIVKLELQGACGSCASSAMTMQMGLEKGLREKIPEIIEVMQVSPEGPELSEEGIEEVLEQIRPFLKVSGSTVDIYELNLENFQPSVVLEITGTGGTVKSVRMEIMARLRRKFPTLANVSWNDY